MPAEPEKTCVRAIKPPRYVTRDDASCGPHVGSSLVHLQHAMQRAVMQGRDAYVSIRDGSRRDEALHATDHMQQAAAVRRALRV